MGAANEILYLKIDQNIRVTDRNVTLQDIAKMECSNEAVTRQLKQKKIYTFSDNINVKKQKTTNLVFSVLKIIELIHQDFPNLLIVNEGESDFVLEYEPNPGKGKWLSGFLVVLLCVVTFFGAAFTIMMFNNDVGVPDVFSKFYYQVMGQEQQGISEIEICYCIGLAIGILVFFNHIGKKKITPDPTPMQVQMRKYEKDVDTTFIDNASRKEHSIDVK